MGRRGRSSRSTCVASRCVYTVTLQAGLDSGYFTRQISSANVYRSVTTSDVSAGIFRSDRTALIFGTLCSTPFGFGALGAHYGFGAPLGFGTPLAGYLPVLAGTGKPSGTGSIGLTL